MKSSPRATSRARGGISLFPLERRISSFDMGMVVIRKCDRKKNKKKHVHLEIGPPQVVHTCTKQRGEPVFRPLQCEKVTRFQNTKTSNPEIHDYSHPQASGSPNKQNRLRSANPQYPRLTGRHVTVRDRS